MNLLSRVVSYFIGTLRLKISGEYCERFLNILAANSVSFWSPYVKKGDFFITVLRKDIKKIRILRRNTGVKIKIVKRKGFPLIVNKYKCRYGLILGVILFLATLNILGKCMWNIKVNGNVKVSEEQIIEFLSENNVNYGDLVKNIDTDILKQKLILTFDNIAWASLNKQGSVLEVIVTEFENNKEINAPYNIIADSDGVIKHLDVSKGSINVKIGDTVFKNQILISGIVNYGYGNNFVEPNGKILAEIKSNKTIEIKKIQTSKNYTGKIKNRYSIEIMGLKIPLYFGKEKKFHETVSTQRKLKIFGGEIPIKVYNDKCIFINEVYFEIDNITAEEMAKNNLMKEFKDLNAQNIIIDLKNMSKKNGNYIFEYSTSCIKDIGKKKIIEFK